MHLIRISSVLAQFACYYKLRRKRRASRVQNLQHFGQAMVLVFHKGKHPMEQIEIS